MSRNKAVYTGSTVGCNYSYCNYGNSKTRLQLSQQKEFNLRRVPMCGRSLSTRAGFVEIQMECS